jgi:hypothetical protein
MWSSAKSRFTQAQVLQSAPWLKEKGLIEVEVQPTED